MILLMNNSSPDRGCMQPRESLELKTGKAMNPWLKRYRHHCAPMSSIRFGKQVILHSKQLLISGQPAGRYLVLDVWHGYPFEVDSKRMASNHIPSKPKKDKYQLTVSAQLWTAAAQLIVTCPNPHPYSRRMGEKKQLRTTKIQEEPYTSWKKILDNPHILLRNRSIWTPTCSLQTSNLFKKNQPKMLYIFLGETRKISWKTQKKKKGRPPSAAHVFPFSPPRRPWQQPVRRPSKIHRTWRKNPWRFLVF